MTEEQLYLLRNGIVVKPTGMNGHEVRVISIPLDYKPKHYTAWEEGETHILLSGNSWVEAQGGEWGRDYDVVSTYTPPPNKKYIRRIRL